jgi:predicted DNA-binding protein YlxM (UPF0122 family)
MDEETLRKRDRLLSLFGEYGPLLSDSQREVFHDYYECDLSLSEIAEGRGISRAAVEDALRKSERKLLSFEEKLHLLEKKETLLSLADKRDIEAVKEYINHGI